LKSKKLALVEKKSAEVSGVSSNMILTTHLKKEKFPSEPTFSMSKNSSERNFKERLGVQKLANLEGRDTRIKSFYSNMICW